LKDNILPDDMASADWIARLAKRYTLVDGDLYRRGVNGVLMRYITREEGCKLLAEVHGGECGKHASSRTLVGKAFQGYCEDLGIQICYASPTHPESNGQMERANTKILKGLKTRTYDGLKKHGKKWIDELPCAL
jgi:hypothetical protein